METKVFGGDALNSREHILYSLTHRWKCLLDDVQDDEFDYDYFRALARDTFRFLFPLRDGSEIPRDVLPMLCSMKAFSVWPVGGLGQYFEDAQMVANGFCEQISNGWLSIDDEVSETLFAFEVPGGFGVVEVESFDLSEL